MDTIVVLVILISVIGGFALFGVLIFNFTTMIRNYYELKHLKTFLATHPEFPNAVSVWQDSKTRYEAAIDEIASLESKIASYRKELRYATNEDGVLLEKLITEAKAKRKEARRARTIASTERNNNENALSAITPDWFTIIHTPAWAKMFTKNS